MAANSTTSAEGHGSSPPEIPTATQAALLPRLVMVMVAMVMAVPVCAVVPRLAAEHCRADGDDHQPGVRSSHG